MPIVSLLLTLTSRSAWGRGGGKGEGVREGEREGEGEGDGSERNERGEEWVSGQGRRVWVSTLSLEVAPGGTCCWKAGVAGPAGVPVP
jgi:hypothetical protein